MNLKEIHYGIEIETVKRTREQIAWAIHSVVGGTVRHVGIPSSYDPWEVEDLRGRVWKVVGDASLTSVPAHLRAEVVSPVLGSAGLVLVLAALVGALTWNLLTWWRGVPSSSTHALVGGLAASAAHRRVRPVTI